MRSWIWGVLGTAVVRLGSVYAEPAMPNDLDFTKQWGLHNAGQAVNEKIGLIGADIDAISAWAIHPVHAPIVVAIVSTGVDPHVEFADRLLDGMATVDDPYDTRDQSWVGTHMAGIIAAARDNGIGVTGIQPAVQILPVRVWGNKTQQHPLDTAQGIEWAVDYGAKIIAVSMNFGSASEPLAEAVVYADSKGALVIAAAGNTGEKDVVRFPAAYEACLAVAATNSVDSLAVASNFGPEVDIVAPGEDIWSTLPESEGGFGFQSTTAASVAHVAGVAALVLSYAPHLSAAQVRQAILDSTDELKIPLPGGVQTVGRLNAARAMQLVSPPPLHIQPRWPLPETVVPDRMTTLELHIGEGAETLLPGSARILTRQRGVDLFASTPLLVMGDGLFQATLPAAPCGSTVEYFLRAVSSTGAEVRHPSSAPDDLHRAEAVVRRVVFHDDFETDRGWATFGEEQATSGTWERFVPVGTTAQPGYDYSRGEKRFCFITGQHGDVDGGPVGLVSPPINLPPSFFDLEISYGVWLASNAETDRLIVQLSLDNGMSWEVADEVDPINPPYWVLRRVDASALPGWPPRSAGVIQARFVIADAPNDSLTEAAIDEFMVSSIQCAVASSDVNGDGLVDRRDAGPLVRCLTGPRIAASSSCDAADINVDGRADLRDFASFQAAFTIP